MKTETKKAFSVLSDYYENKVDLISPNNVDYERPAMVSLFPSELQEKKILDAGCAAGWYTNYFLEKGANVTAIDLCAEMAEATRRRCGKKNAHVLTHDLSDPLPFPDNYFDIILSSLALHFLKDWNSTFQEFHRVLKKNGTFFFSVVHPFATLAPPFVSENYFETELVHEIWDKEKKLNIYYYRRSMQTIFKDTSQYFIIEELIEPQPQRSYEIKDSKMYNKLMIHPHFLIVKAKCLFCLKKN